MSRAPRVDILNFNFFDWSGERVFTGGAERYVYDLASLCRRVGLYPRLLQNADKGFERRFKGIDVIGIPATQSIDTEALSRAFAPMTQDAALIIASPVELACRLGASPPVIGISHGITWDSPANRRSTFSLSRFQLLFDALDIVSRCVCVDTNLANWLQSVDGRASRLVDYIPNYVDSQRFEAKKKRFDQRRLNVLFPRRLREERGFYDVLEAFDVLLRRHEDLALHLCGGGSPSEEQLADEFLRRHPGRVRWSELPMDAMPQVYAESHIVLIPSVSCEGTSLSCIEAMACNNAVIATTVGGLPNLVIDEFNGLLVRPGAGSLIAAIERLLADRMFLKTLAHNALGVSGALSHARWEERWLRVLSACTPLKPGMHTSAAARQLKPRRGRAAARARQPRPPTPVDPHDEAAHRAREWLREALLRHDLRAIEQIEEVADRHAAATQRDLTADRLAAASQENERLVAAMGAALGERDTALRTQAAIAAERDAALARSAMLAGERDTAVSSREEALAARLVADAERGAALRAEAAMTAERDAALRAEAAMTAERDAALRAEAAMTAERDAALGVLAAMTAARDAAVVSRDQAMAARHAAAAERDAAIARRDAETAAHARVCLERDHVAAERDAAQDELMAAGKELTDLKESLRTAQDAHAQVSLDRDRALARHEVAAQERDAARAESIAADQELAKVEESLRVTQEAKSHLETRHYWVASELQGIKASTGWHLLQVLYKIRFAMFPRGSRREALGKKLMQAQRRLRQHAASHRGGAQRLVAVAGLEGETTGKVLPASPLTALRAAFRPLAPAQRYAVLYLVNIEWGFRFQRPQQIARCFARNGHPVFYSRLSFGDRLTSKQLEPGVEEIELAGPKGLNPYQSQLDSVSAQRMADDLLAHLAQSGCRSFVCIILLPFWTPLAQLLQQRSNCDIVYDCMDYHAGFSTNSPEMIAVEDHLIGLADLVIASSMVLRDRLAASGKNVTLVQNAADYDHFSSAVVPAHDSAHHLVVGYYGAIADWFDSQLLAGVARLRPDWRFELVGSTFTADTHPLTAQRNIVLLGEQPYTELPRIIGPWDCCIIPFKRNRLTEATNPVKVYEMLAAAKVIVAVNLPELESMAATGLITLASSAQDFVAKIEDAVRRDTAEQQAARRAFAARNTWQSRHIQFSAAIAAIRPLVTVIIVTYNNLALNRQCLASVLDDTDYPAIEVIVVDNASTDGTPDFLTSLTARDPRVRVVLNAENRGFSAANNQGAALANGRYLCFLNNDTVVHGGWLSTLVRQLRVHPTLGLVGPVTNAIGNEAKIPVGYDSVADMPAWADQYCAAHRDELRDISMLAFFCVAIPRHVWDLVGPLDERFGIGMFEDDDYNRRVRAVGYDVRLALDSFVHHWQKASFDLLSKEEYLRIFRENETLYYAKWEGPTAAEEPATDELTPLRRYASAAKGTVIFATAVSWKSSDLHRPHHFAGALARDGYAVVFAGQSEAGQGGAPTEVQPGIFVYADTPEPLAGLPNTLLWTCSPNFAFRDRFPPWTPVVYDWSTSINDSGSDPANANAMHRRALREATLVTCGSRYLHEQAVLSRPDAIYLPNGVEEYRFVSAPHPNLARNDPALRAVLNSGNPIAGYAGELDESVEYELLLRTAERRPDWSFVLIGPDLDGSLGRVALDRCSNVSWIGARDYLLLPSYLHLFDVALIPLWLNAKTTAESPPMLYEYFAAGKPVVSTPLPECKAFPEVHIAESAESFAACLDAAQASSGSQRARLTQLAAENTWRARTRTVLSLLHASASLKSGPSAAGQRVITERFRHFETPTNRRFFRALATHFGPMADDPSLPALLAYAITANDRGRDVAKRVSAVTSLAGKRVLDIDCTYGGTLLGVAQLGAEPEGMDRDNLLLNLARHNFSDTNREFPLYKLDLATAEDVGQFGRRYDVIISNSFLERTNDPGTAIEHIRDMLRSDGVAYCDIPNRDAVSRLLEAGPHLLFGLESPDVPAVPIDFTHRRYPSLVEYQALFARAGFATTLAPQGDCSTTLANAADKALAELRQSLPAHLDQLPVPLRAEAESALRQYLTEAEAAARTGLAGQLAFGTRYQCRYLTLVARPLAS